MVGIQREPSGELTAVITQIQHRLFNALVISEVWTMIRPAAFATNTLRAATTLAALAAVLVTSHSQQAEGQGLNYVEADDFFAPNLSPLSAINSSGTANDTDNLWGFRASFGAAGTIYQSGISEDSPEISQLITGLTPGVSYDLYAVYWTDDDENWTIRAGTTSGNLTLYSFSSAAGNAAGATKGLTAGAAIWSSPPPATIEGTIFTQPRPTSTEPFQDPLVMLLGKAGTATASGSGEISVYVDDLPSAGGGNRVWFDGIAYVNAGTQVALTASIDRATGALTINNPTASNFQIKAITLDSPFGSLSTTGWTPISGRLDAGGNMSFDADPWMTTPPATTPFATQLIEAEAASGGGTGGTLAAGGGSLGLGNVWARTHVEDVRIYLTLANDTLAVISPQFTGTPLLQGDFNASGGPIDLADFQTLLTNLHTNVTALTNVERYRRGDMNANGQINFADWAAFRAAFNAANGAGAFETMLAQIPEPSSLALLIVVGAAAAGRARRRLVSVCVALTTCCLLAGPAGAATLLKVDVDHFNGDATAGPPGDNTVPGFSSYTLTAEGVADTTQVISGYTITVRAMNASHTTQGLLRTRDRATPTTAPTLNQLYDDFIFADVGSTGEGGGLDMVINSGGALMPNTQYSISIYSFDTSSTGLRTANWLDGNNGNAVALTTSFDGVNSPATDEQYRFSGLFRTDGSGNLLLRGRETAAASHGVFLNGFEISDELPPPPVELTLRVNTTTGNISILNEQAVSIDMSYYEIRSTAGSLNLGGWSSLDDAEGGDPVGTGWDEAPASTANLLSEVNLQSMSTFAPGGSASLGNAFSVGQAQDISFFYAGPGATVLRSGIVSYVTGANDADFDNDSDVDGNDFLIWQRGVGVGNNNATGDANASGTVDGADLAIWRSQFGPASTAAAAAVPEPGSLALLVVAGIGGLAAGRVSTIRRR
jgi:hypothetical protein